MVGGENGLDLRSKDESIPVPGVEERLLTDPVPREYQSVKVAIPDREGEHAAQLFDAALTFLLVEMDDYFRVASGREDVSLFFQILAQRAVVVDLSVEDDPYRSVFVPDRLVSTLGVDDAEATTGQTDGPAQEGALVVGSSVGEARAHAGEPFHLRTGGAVLSADTAHQRGSVGTLGGGDRKLVGEVLCEHPG